MNARVRLDHDHLHHLLRQLVRIRHFEAKCVELYQAQKILGFLHLYDGEEAVSVGVMEALGAEDAIVATYREHGQAIARGVAMDRLMAEMLGKQEGCCRGRGGSMHIFDRATRFYGGNAIVGGGLPLAIGVALGDKMQSKKALTACFFGDGAVEEGEFHESMNLAEVWKLPVLFVCENNLYSMGMAVERAESETNIARKAAAYRMPGVAVDGMDVVAVEAAAREAVERIRAGGGPQFLECRTYRFRAHSMFDSQAYRSKDEIETWRSKGPIARFEGWLRESGLAHEEDVARIEAEANAEIEAAVAFAEAGTREPVEELERFVTMDQVAVMSDVAAMTYREACKQGIRDALLADPKCFLMGEDVGRYGGCYAVTKGLLEEFGEERIRDTPLSESAYVGAGIGAALAGMRPIVEIMTVNFSLLALDQIVNNAATIPHMSGGQFAVPLVIRMATGGGRRVAAQHSHSLEGWYAHIPWLRILAPAVIEDARWMLAAALADPNPVLIFEHVMLYNMEGALDPAVTEVDIAQAKCRRDGRDVTLIGYGNGLLKALAAADLLEADGIAAEVIDLRVLRPLDTATILASVTKTRRVVIVDEGWKSGSLAAEIGMRIVEDGFFDLDAPLRRVCGREVPMPYAPHLEDAALPQPADIAAAARGLVRGR